MKHKIITCLVVLLTSTLSIAHEKLTYDDLNRPRWGYVIKDNDTLFGSIELLNRSIRIDLNKKKKDYLSPKIDWIVWGDKMVKYIDKYICCVIDTPRMVRVYEGYSQPYSTIYSTSVNGGLVSVHVNTKQLDYSYIVQIGTREPRVFREQIMGIEKFRFNRQLKSLFSNKKNIVDYLDNLNDIKFDDIPAVIDHINLIYK
ncbi:MAG: hypothetical protein JWN78_2991 [Bacteroidota bacterium]|nr:hypothetical protein [Bacteroidota bacterium]